MLGRAIRAIVLIATFFPALAVCDSRTIPAGTKFDFRLRTKLSTKASRVGDPFTGSFEQPVLSGQDEVVPTGSTAEGHITKLRKSGHHAAGYMQLLLDSITTPHGTVYNITSTDVKLIGARGTVQDGGKGTTRPALPAGAIMIVRVRYEEAALKPGSVLTFLVERDVTAAKANAPDKLSPR